MNQLLKKSFSAMINLTLHLDKSMKEFPKFSGVQQ